MKQISYLSYFIYLFRYWNFKLAAFTMKHELAGERKYRIHTIGTNSLKRLSISGNLRHASIYQPASFYLLEKAFAYLKHKHATGALVDYGSGKGRILAVAAYHEFRDITGVEFARALHNAAQKNIEAIKHFYPGTTFRFLCINATDYEVRKEDAVFFFFNPFDEVIMLSVVKNILRSVREHPRKIFVVYINPMHKEIFESAGFIEEYYVSKLEYLEMSILTWHE